MTREPWRMGTLRVSERDLEKRRLARAQEAMAERMRKLGIPASSWPEDDGSEDGS